MESFAFPLEQQYLELALFDAATMAGSGKGPFPLNLPPIRQEVTMKHLIVLFVVATVSFTSKPLFAQSPFWQPTNGPNDGEVWSVMMDSSGFIFAGCDSGIFRSSDQGSTWRKLDVDAPLVLAFAVNHAGDLYACSLNGVLYTSDHGDTWQLMNDSLPVQWGFPPVYPGYIALDNADNVFVGLRDGGVFWLPRGKTSWVRRNTGLPYEKATGLAISSTGTMVVAVDTSGLFRSTDQGLTWSRQSTGLTNPWVASVACDLNGRFFVGTQGGVFRSTDDGLTWKQQGNNSAGASIRSFVARRGGWLLACDHGGSAYRSTDDGDSWIRIFDYMYSDQGWALEVTRENKILFGSGLGLYRSMATDTSWELVGLPIAHIEWMMAHSSGRLFARGGHGMYLSYSSDHGHSWVHDSLLWSNRIVELRDGSILASESNSLYRSTNTGESWEDIGKSPFPSFQSFLIDPNGAVYAGTPLVIPDLAGSVYRSTDMGTSWTLVASLGQSVTTLAMNKSGDMFAIASLLFRSTDQGTHWNPLFRQGSITAFAVAPDGPLVIGSGGYLYRSTNNGDTWDLVTTFGSTVTSLLIASDNSVYCGTAGLGVFVRHGNDSSFVPLQSGMSTKSITALTTDREGFLYAGTVIGGVFRSTNPITSVERPSGELPSAFTLEQNYPNPFNPTTKIRYATPQRSHISLIVYNTVGQQVATLVNGEVQAGYHEVLFNASSLASGVYFYRLETPGFVQSRKLLLVR
jgi:photosystem II stability/assembly factor-like uncharacterized protein